MQHTRIFFVDDFKKFCKTLVYDLCHNLILILFYFGSQHFCKLRLRLLFSKNSKNFKFYSTNANIFLINCFILCPTCWCALIRVKNTQKIDFPRQILLIIFSKYYCCFHCYPKLFRFGWTICSTSKCLSNDNCHFSTV